MDTSVMTALLIWIAGIPVAAWIAYRATKRAPARAKARQQEATAKAYGEDVSPEEAAKHRRRAEREHDRAYRSQHILDRGGDTFSGMYFVTGIAWPFTLLYAIFYYGVGGVIWLVRKVKKTT